MAPGSEVREDLSQRGEEDGKEDKKPKVLLQQEQTLILSSVRDAGEWVQLALQTLPKEQSVGPCPFKASGS